MGYCDFYLPNKQERVKVSFYLEVHPPLLCRQLRPRLGRTLKASTSKAKTSPSTGRGTVVFKVYKFSFLLHKFCCLMELNIIITMHRFQLSRFHPGSEDRISTSSDWGRRAERLGRSLGAYTPVPSTLCSTGAFVRFNGMVA